MSIRTVFLIVFGLILGMIIPFQRRGKKSMLADLEQRALQSEDGEEW